MIFLLLFRRLFHSILRQLLKINSVADCKTLQRFRMGAMCSVFFVLVRIFAVFFRTNKAFLRKPGEDTEIVVETDKE